MVNDHRHGDRADLEDSGGEQKTDPEGDGHDDEVEMPGQDARLQRSARSHRRSPDRSYRRRHARHAFPRGARSVPGSREQAVLRKQSCRRQIRATASAASAAFMTDRSSDERVGFTAVPSLPRHRRLCGAPPRSRSDVMLDVLNPLIPAPLECATPRLPATFARSLVARVRRDGTCCPAPSLRSRQRRTSRIKLKGVSAARRKRVKPALRNTSARRASPACAPRTRSPPSEIA